MFQFINSKALLTLLTLGTLTLSACSMDDLGFSFDDIDFDFDSNSEESTSGIISSLNPYIDFLNDASYEVDYIESDLYYYDQDVADYEEYGFDPIFSCLYVSPEEYDYDLYSKLQNPSTLLPEEDRSNLTASANQLIQILETIEEGCEDLDIYISSQNYLDDNFAAGNLFANGLNSEIQNYYTQHNFLTEHLDELYELYEEPYVVDESDPNDVAFGNMKVDIELADDIHEFIGEAYENTDFSEKETLTEMYNELVSNVKNNTANIPEMTEPIYESYYEDFYHELETEFLPTLVRAQRNFNADTLFDLSSDYSEMINSYNWMIEYYNWYLDEWEY
jgi:hypothetical protein